ncbi:hypothetical protein R1flu_013229 [Riccia fluitans]
MTINEGSHEEKRMKRKRSSLKVNPAGVSGIRKPEGIIRKNQDKLQRKEEVRMGIDVTVVKEGQLMERQFAEEKERGKELCALREEQDSVNVKQERLLQE